ncbi:MAG: hypothetical protein QF408_14445, partial [Pirellulales bacterium]|nr:hypothetical protein [Pirellulales bacterium]
MRDSRNLCGTIFYQSPGTARTGVRAPTVLAALVYILSLYPIGSHIVMSNGALGTVVQSNQED